MCPGWSIRSALRRKLCTPPRRPPNWPHTSGETSPQDLSSGQTTNVFGKRPASALVSSQLSLQMMGQQFWGAQLPGLRASKTRLPFRLRGTSVLCNPAALSHLHSHWQVLCPPSLTETRPAAGTEGWGRRQATAAPLPQANYFLYEIRGLATEGLNRHPMPTE